MDIYVSVAARLIDLEGELRRLGYWQQEALAPEALHSCEPFCVDTMSAAQWLQFVFLPRMHQLMAARQLPPGRCEVAPLAEQYFGATPTTEPLLEAIRDLDRLVSSPS